MPQYNDMFELTVEDMDLIERSLRNLPEALPPEGREETERQIHDLLGRLHNQKIFYRPKSGVYIGG
ncbi:hypothetical protein Q5Y75_15075 [Ruegeria sp. 2205SS24-7]|uniref:hypothetical protein n=1 Tax=Ruegeria discodermiae TaxID=3064389 RepID=UPI0027404E56|nr:hypothetical protein [Ruegeria sp. 2205SS24-7]MDP5218549.1 hypothetical protein [Ruegeria sp. 2205SS24-7]